MADDLGSSPKVPKSIIEVTAFMPEARRDPHPPLKALREQCPAMRDEMAKAWFLTRYGDVRTTVNDRSFVRHPLNAEEGSISRQLVDEENPRRTSILFMDDPDHARVRPPLAKAFYTRINKMKDQIEAIVDETIEAAPASGVFDLMAEIAVPIPVTVIARILGLTRNASLISATGPKM
jgi:cytochrome P450